MKGTYCINNSDKKYLEKGSTKSIQPSTLIYNIYKKFSAFFSTLRSFYKRIMEIRNDPLLKRIYFVLMITALQIDL